MAHAFGLFTLLLLTTMCRLMQAQTDVEMSAYIFGINFNTFVLTIMVLCIVLMVVFFIASYIGYCCYEAWKNEMHRRAVLERHRTITALKISGQQQQAAAACNLLTPIPLLPPGDNDNNRQLIPPPVQPQKEQLSELSKRKSISNFTGQVASVAAVASIAEQKVSADLSSGSVSSNM